MNLDKISTHMSPPFTSQLMPSFINNDLTESSDNNLLQLCLLQNLQLLQDLQAAQRSRQVELANEKKFQGNEQNGCISNFDVSQMQNQMPHGHNTLKRKLPGSAQALKSPLLQLAETIDFLNTSQGDNRRPGKKTGSLNYPSSQSVQSVPSLSSTCSSTSERFKPKLCSVEGCNTQDKGGGLCAKHGGGKPCNWPGCQKIVAGTRFCSEHGGTRKKLCQKEGCKKGDQGGGFCAAHGGGSRCKLENCGKRAVGSGLCWGHGGGRRCKISGCNRSPKSCGLCKLHIESGSDGESLLQSFDSGVSEKSVESNQ